MRNLGNHLLRKNALKIIFAIFLLIVYFLCICLIQSNIRLTIIARCSILLSLAFAGLRDRDLWVVFVVQKLLARFLVCILLFLVDRFFITFDLSELRGAILVVGIISFHIKLALFASVI